MRHKVTLLGGFATGYVLGAKAGRQRYESIMQVARNVMEKPAVQQTAGVVQAQASDLAETAKRVVTDKVGGRSSARSFEDDPTIDSPVYPAVAPTTASGVTPTDDDPARH